MSDQILSTAGGSVAFGKDPETLYLGTGDPFDPGVGGWIYKSTDGGGTWSVGIKLGTSSVIPDVKVDTTGAQDVVFAGTNAGLFRSLNGGATYAPVINGGLHWSIQQTNAGWMVAIGNGANAIIGRAASAVAPWVLDFTAAGMAPAGRITLAAAAPGDAVVYAFASTTGSAAQKDLYRSANGGATFTALGLPAKTPTNPNEDQPNMDIMMGQAFYNQILFVDPNDTARNTVYIGRGVWDHKF